MARMLRLLVASLSWAAARADTCTALRGGPFTYEQESAPRDISAALRLVTGLINKELTPNRVLVDGLGTAAATTATLHSVEPNGRVSSRDAGIAVRTVAVAHGRATVVLPPFAVAVLVLA